MKIIGDFYANKRIIMEAAYNELLEFDVTATLLSLTPLPSPHLQ